MRKIHLLGPMFVVMLLGCQEAVNPRVATRLNDDAAVVGDLPSNPLQEKVITSWLDRKNGTMSTLYGNELAIQHARTSAAADYPNGSVLSLVTWKEQEDPRWFGGRIPQRPTSVEIVTVHAAPDQYTYQRFENSPLKKVDEHVAPYDRAAYLLNQRAAVMP